MTATNIAPWSYFFLIKENKERPGKQEREISGPNSSICVWDLYVALME